MINRTSTAENENNNNHVDDPNSNGNNNNNNQLNGESTEETALISSSRSGGSGVVSDTGSNNGGSSIGGGSSNGDSNDPISQILWDEQGKPWPATFERSISLLASPIINKDQADLYTKSPKPGNTPLAQRRQNVSSYGVLPFFPLVLFYHSCTYLFTDTQKFLQIHIKHTQTHK